MLLLDPAAMKAAGSAATAGTPAASATGAATNGGRRCRRVRLRVMPRPRTPLAKEQPQPRTPGAASATHALAWRQARARRLRLQRACMTVTVMNKVGHSFKLSRVGINELVANVKAKIQDRTGLHPGNQRLLSESVVLRDDVSLADLKDGGKLLLLQRLDTFIVRVSNQDGGLPMMLYLEGHPFMTVRALIAAIQAHFGPPRGTLMLMVGQRFIHARPGRTLVECGVGADSDIGYSVDDE